MQHLVPHLAQLAAAQTATSTLTDDLGGLISSGLKAFESKNWVTLAGVVLMLLMVVIRRVNLLQKIPADYIPLATGVMAMIASVALGLMEGQPWPNIVGTGLSVGLTAIGAWEALGKPVAKALASKPESK